MHTKRFATLLLGMWLAGSIFMMAVATWNFAGVDRLLAEPDMSANQYIKVLGADSARMLLRHQVAELNRTYFDAWEVAQFGIGITLIVTLLFATNGERLYMIGCGLLLLLVLVEHFLLTPQITGIGRLIDFVPPDAPSPERVRFWRFHNAYATLEVLKLLLLIGLSARLLIIQSRRRNRPRKKLDLVDDAENGGVDR